MDSIPLEPWLDHLEAHLPAARAGSDPEGVHQVRVALGRLDLWLRAGDWRVLRDDVRWLRRGAARVRDLEVQLASDPPASWARILEREHRLARAALAALLDDPRAAGLREGLRCLPALPAEALRDLVRSLSRDVARRGVKLEEQPLELERYHELRRAVRRLRFGLEWLEESARPVKLLQETLGELNDAAVCLALLEELDGQDELAEFRARHAARLEDMRHAVLEAWRASDFDPEI